MSDFKILSQLNSPEDLRKLPDEELPELCSEIKRKVNRSSVCKWRSPCL